MGSARRSARRYAQIPVRPGADIVLNNRNLPSCDQSDGYMGATPLNSASVLPPATDSTSSPKPASGLPETANARCDPSGDQTGDSSSAAVAVNCAAVPSELSSHKSARPFAASLAAAARFPSGEILGGPQSPVSLTIVIGLPLRSHQTICRVVPPTVWYTNVALFETDIGASEKVRNAPIRVPSETGPPSSASLEGLNPRIIASRPRTKSR